LVISILDMVPGTRVPGTVPGTVVEAVGPYLVVGKLNRYLVPAGTRYALLYQHHLLVCPSRTYSGVHTEELNYK